MFQSFPIDFKVIAGCSIDSKKEKVKSINKNPAKNVAKWCVFFKII